MANSQPKWKWVVKVRKEQKKSWIKKWGIRRKTYENNNTQVENAKKNKIHNLETIEENSVRKYIGAWEEEQEKRNELQKKTWTERKMKAHRKGKQWNEWENNNEWFEEWSRRRKSI